MCIICVKPKTFEMPSAATLNTMWQANADGAGFAYWRPNDKSVHIEKGFMKLKALKTALSDLNFGPDDLVILHFRWATHGLVDGGNCHPFPLSAKTECLRATSGQFDTAIAHNGVFGNLACHETLSDTQKFIGRIMANPAIIGNIDNPAIMELISGYCGSSSKLSILRPGKLLLIGDFERDEDTGLVYSNGGYKNYKKTYNGRQGHMSFYDKTTDYITPIDCAIPKCCELCQAETEIDYDEEFQLFLCDKCFDYNVQYVEPAKIKSLVAARRSDYN